MHLPRGGGAGHHLSQLQGWWVTKRSDAHGVVAITRSILSRLILMFDRTLRFLVLRPFQVLLGRMSPVIATPPLKHMTPYICSAPFAGGHIVSLHKRMLGVRRTRDRLMIIAILKFHPIGVRNSILGLRKKYDERRVYFTYFDDFYGDRYPFWG